MSSKESSKELTVREHLEEFRRRLTVAALVMVVTTALAFVFHRQLLFLLIAPAERALGERPPMVFTAATEMLGISMKVALMGGLVLSIPVWVYEIVMFVAPGLTPKERRLLLMFMPGVFLAFVAGVLFGYFILIPPGLRFLLTFNTDIAEPFIGIGNFVNLVINLLFWLGAVFETPVLMFLLAKIGVVNHRTFARWRKMAYIGAFVLGAAITPTFDPVNQTLVAVPIILLYELGIILAWLARRGKAKGK
ncbi:MAG: twin-arginine translocase subunit TatC [Chloroflexi bacterium]|nr:twin-arginine translocase subunit TatC [Chloroflexota bacterium]